MTPEPNLLTTKTLIIGALLCASGFCTVASFSFAQTADNYSIRVESNQVVVPTYIYDKDRMIEPSTMKETRCGLANMKKFDKLLPSEAYIPANCDESQVLGLAAKDFHIFDDGREQRIQNVTVERLHDITVRDNMSWHNEFSDTPIGKWSASDLPPLQMGFGPSEAIYFYLIAYLPPKSPEGSCHRIKVKVERRNSFVYTRSEYCNAVHSSSDPLNGTKFGKQLEGYAAFGKDAKIALSIQTGYFYTGANRARVDITAEFSWNSLRRQWIHATLDATIGIMGVAYKEDGTVAARFSDMGCCPSDKPHFVRGRHPYQAHPEMDVAFIPNRFETQIDLLPGKYNLQIVLGDGSKFGRVEVPLAIDSYDGNQLALSSVVLCKRFRDAAAAAQEAAAANLAPQYVPLVSNGTQFTPAGDTHFRKGEPLFAYFEVYEPLPATTSATTVQIRMKITNVKTGELKVDTGLRNASSSSQPGSTVIPIAQKVAVDQLPPGSYKLEVQASDSAERSTVWRTATFTVE